MEKRFTAKDFNIAYRTINYWNEKGIFLDDKEGKEKWRTFSCLDYVWLRAVIELRALGYPLDALAEVKHWLLRPFTKGELFNQLLEITAKVNDFMATEQERKIHQSFDLPTVVMLADELGTGDFTDPVPQTSLLLSVLGEIVALRQDYSLLVNRYGEAQIWNHSKADTLVKLGADGVLRGHHTSISLTSIVAELVELEERYKDLVALEIVSEQERLVLNHIRSGKLKTLTIRFSDNGTMRTLELTEVIGQDEMKARLMDFVMRGGYHDISYKTQDGRIVHFERTTKVNMQ